MISIRKLEPSAMTRVRLGAAALVLASLALWAPQTAHALAMSRGYQSLPLTYQQCLQRAYEALHAEGYNATPSTGAGFVGGFKGAHGAYITCAQGQGSSPAEINVFVATENTNDSNLPGAERVRLQQRLAGTAPPPPPPAPPPAQPPAPTPPPPAPPAAGLPFRLYFANNATSMVAAPKQSIEVFFTRPAGRGSRDWIGLFKPNTPNQQHLGQWAYTHAETSGVRTYYTPDAPGDYELRFLLDDGYDKVVAQASFRVSADASGQQRLLPPPAPAPAPPPVATAPPPPPMPPAPGQLRAGTFAGCYKDTSAFDLNGHLVRSPQNTPQRCMQTCAEKGFKFAGVQYGESCLCGNAYGKYGTASNCTMACTGDRNQICGGINANSIYATGR